jgi:hypothetical protein
MAAARRDISARICGTLEKRKLSMSMPISSAETVRMWRFLKIHSTLSALPDNLRTAI